MRFRITKAFCLLIVMMMLCFFPNETYATTGGGLQDVMQKFEIWVQDLSDSTRNATQKFTVSVNSMEVTATQKFKITVYDGVIELAAEGPEPIILSPSASQGAGHITTLVRAGTTKGYKLDYEFSDTDLVCLTNEDFAIPTITTAGTLTNSSWGYNIVAEANTVPDTWRVVLTTPELLAQASGGMAEDEWDEWYMTIGARAEGWLPACLYQNIVQFTAVSGI